MKIKKIIFILMIYFIYSIFIYADEEGTLNVNNEMSVKEKPLYLFYKIDIEKNLLILKWNKVNNSKDKYYIFNKEKFGDWNLINKDGVIGEQYEMDLNECNNKYFVVCKTQEIQKNMKNVIAFSMYDDDFVGMFRELKGTQYIESNAVYIKINNKNIKEVKIDKNINNAEDKFEDKIKEDSYDDTFYVVNDKILSQKEMEEIEKIKKLQTKKIDNILNEIKKIEDALKLNNNNLKDIKGLFKINSNKLTEINYLGLKLSIPEGTASENSYIFIIPLTNENLVEICDWTENITYIKEDNNYKGYYITLINNQSNNEVVVKSDKQEKAVDITEYNKNNLNRIIYLNNSIEISMKFNQGKEDDAIFLYNYNEMMEEWKSIVQIKEVNLAVKGITSIANTLGGEYYVGRIKL